MWTIHRISDKNAKTYKFDMKEKATGIVHKDTSIYQYFQKKYNVVLEKWALPLLETPKKGIVFPMELAFMGKGQRYPYKLNETQVCFTSRFTIID